MAGGTGTGALAEAAAGAETGTPSAAGMARTAAAGVDRNTSSNELTCLPWDHFVPWPELPCNQVLTKQMIAL